MKPHKNAELIKAWADGAIIQYFNPQENEWIDCCPDWNFKDKYRLKPLLEIPHNLLIEIDKFGLLTIKYSQEPNLKLLIDENGKIKSAKLI